MLLQRAAPPTARNAPCAHASSLAALSWPDLAKHLPEWYARVSAYAHAAGLRTGRCPLTVRPGEQALFWGKRKVFQSPDPAGLLAVADWCLLTTWVHRLFESHFVHHAASLERDDHALVLLGPSGAGKSSLALELIRRGLRYLCDEYAIIEPRTLRALPFPRALRIKRETSGRLPTCPTSDPDFDVARYPARFHQRRDSELACFPRPHVVPPPGERFPVRWVVFLTPVPGGTPRVVPRSEAMRRLYETSRGPAPETFRAIAAFTRQARFWETGRFELAAMTDQILAFLDSTKDGTSN